MKIIINNIIPFKGYLAITIWPFIFARKVLKQIDVNHENIHGEQQKELLLLPFFLIYTLEYIIKFIITLRNNKAYHSISFEQEAYYNESNYNYIHNRKHYTWIKYIFKMYNFNNKIK